MVAPSVTDGPAGKSADLAELALQVEDLRQRVLRLEHSIEPAEAAPIHTSAEVHEKAPDGGFGLQPNIVPVLGRMLLAIAGAYVLRAMTEWGVLPAGAGVGIGLVYAVVWLWVAARSPVEAKTAAALNGLTSVLIMSPLLWEATIRLKVMSSWMSAGVLAGFAITAFVLGRGPHRGIVATIGAGASMVIALALMLARDDAVPFITALLIVACVAEFAASDDLLPGMRVFGSLAAGSAVLMFSLLFSNPHGMPDSWVSAAPWMLLASQAALALIYSASAAVQAAVRHRTLTFAEIGQTAMALLIGIGGAAWNFREDRRVMLGLGITALAGGMACYAVSFLLLERQNKRNFRALATFGLFLVVAGIFLPFSRSAFWTLACICALACCQAARQFRLPTLGLHGAVYLLVGSFAATVTSQSLAVLFGFGARRLEWLPSMAVLLTAAICWTAVAGISADVSARWRNQISSLAIATQIVWILAGLAVYTVVAIWPTAPVDTSGTVFLTGLALTLAWAGTDRGASELVWLAYGIMALGAYKLAVRDFINEHNLALVVSLFCYGGALIILPRVLRKKSVVL